MKKTRLNRISIFLDEVDLDQKELAELLKISKDTVSRWCRNVSQPSLKMLHEIAELGRVDIRILLEPSDWSDLKGPSPIEKYLEEKEAKKKETSKHKK